MWDCYFVILLKLNLIYFVLFFFMFVYFIIDLLLLVFNKFILIGKMDYLIVSLLIYILFCNKVFVVVIVYYWEVGI